MKWFHFGIAGLLVACQPAPAPAPMVQQTSGSLQTIQDAYLARQESLKNTQQLWRVQRCLDSLSSVTRGLEATVTELQVKILVKERLEDQRPR